MTANLNRPTNCNHDSDEPGWMCPHVYEGLSKGESVPLTVCDVGGVACEAYCPNCRKNLDTFDLNTDAGVEAAFQELNMQQMCLGCFKELIQTMDGYDPQTMSLD